MFGLGLDQSLSRPHVADIRKSVEGLYRLRDHLGHHRLKAGTYFCSLTLPGRY